MTVRYAPGMVLLRSTTWPGGPQVPHDLDPSDPGSVRSRGLAWLAGAWGQAEVRDAVETASPDLASQVTRLLRPGTRPADKDLRRTVMAVAAYMLRWQRRVTPFGLFAGVMPVTVGPASAALDAGGQAVARADSDWTAALAAALDRDPDLRLHLAVTVSNLAVVRDGRLVIARRTPPGAAVLGPAEEASVRWTRPVRAAVEAAQSPVGVAVLEGKLEAQFPEAPPGSVSAVIDGLIDAGFLVTSLYPPQTAADPLAHLTGALRDAGAGQVPGRLLAELEEIAALISAHNQAPPSQAPALRGLAASRMRELAPAAQPLQVDVRLTGSASLPQAVLEEAAAAATVLLRLSARPWGVPGWTDYHQRFRRRYGLGALVPVRELTSDAGLGYPDGFAGGPGQRPAWRMLTDRDAAFLALVQKAVLAGQQEIRLGTSDIEALTTGDHRDAVLPERAEIGVCLRAASAEDIDAGRFTLRLTATPRTPTSMAGRFTHLLPGEEHRRLAPQDSLDTLAVQLSFPPRSPHAENVTRARPLTRAVLPLGEHPPEPEAGTMTVGIDDLAVTCDGAQMYLVHAPTGRRAVPLIPHALDVKARTPPLARFIAEVASARSAFWGPFDYGAARALPYIPRLRHGRTILAPARWRLPSGDVLCGQDPDGGAAARLAAWRQAWRVPARVIMHDDEHRLPLDLGQPLDRALLLARLARHDVTELWEDDPPEASGWAGGRPAELLVTLTLTGQERPLPATAPPGRVHRPGGSPVVCARITGNPLRFDAILTGHLPALMDRIEAVTGRWWIRRHRDMMHTWEPQHLALLIRLRDPCEFGAVARELAGLAEELAAAGLPGDLSLASYAEHPGRYGEGPAMAAAEEVFATDTLAAIAQITAASASDAAGQALTAASMTSIAAAFAANQQAGYRALTRCLDQGSGPLDRSVREDACRLANPADGHAALRALPGGQNIADTWRRRDTALAAYHATLASQRKPGTVLRTLLHEHHMRALGIDPDLERQTGRHARAAALRRLALDPRS
jgi:thiopeptide-type bacteriocin biosynthesis protein